MYSPIYDNRKLSNIIHTFKRLTFVWDTKFECVQLANNCTLSILILCSFTCFSKLLALYSMVGLLGDTSKEINYLGYLIPIFPLLQLSLRLSNFILWLSCSSWNVIAHGENMLTYQRQVHQMQIMYYTHYLYNTQTHITCRQKCTETHRRTYIHTYNIDHWSRAIQTMMLPTSSGPNYS